MNEMLDRFEHAAAKGDRVSLDDLMDLVGRRSFGPILLLAGIIMSAPGISDIPGVPTMVGIFTLTVSVQILVGRHDLWLPGWMLRRSVSSGRLKKMTESKWIRRPASWIDKFTSRRLEALAGPGSNFIVAPVCTLLALVCPFTEFIPLSGPGVGAAIVAFAISLIARDGLMTLIGLAISTVTVSLAIVAAF